LANWPAAFVQPRAGSWDLFGEGGPVDELLEDVGGSLAVAGQERQAESGDRFARGSQVPVVENHEAQRDQLESPAGRVLLRARGALDSQNGPDQVLDRLEGIRAEAERCGSWSGS